MEALTNKELQRKLKHYPEDMLIFISKPDSVYTKCNHLRKRWLYPINKECIVLESEAPYPEEILQQEKKFIKKVLKIFNKQFIRMNKFFSHLKTILIHKKWVLYYCHKCGFTWAGIMHDVSKFSPIEFWESVKYYQGTQSPIVACKKDKGYSLAWLHHKGRNPHHYEYWTDNYDSGTTRIKMPFRYVVELICDYLAAGKTYNGKKFTYKSEYNWWLMNKDSKYMHPKTKDFVEMVFAYLASGVDVLNKKTLKHLYSITNADEN